MNITTPQKILIALAGAVIAVSLLGCSDEEKPKQTEAAAQQATSESGEKIISKDSPHDSTPEAEESQKQKFEHEFASQCVDRELNNASNKIEDASKITKSCECISAYIMKDLTDEEAEKFLKEHEHPQSLRIKFEAAAYECLQEKAQPAGPKMFGKPQ
jgi:hypothetical protein